MNPGLSMGLAVLLPLLVMVMTARSELSSFAVKLDKDDFRVPEQPEDEPDVRLGIEESTASTVTWIGYDTYQEHMAALAIVFGVLSVVAGLYASLYWDLPSGPLIVVTAALLFGLTQMWPRSRSVSRGSTGAVSPP